MAQKNQTNILDWVALIPGLPAEGSRAAAVYAAIRALIEAGQLPPGCRLPPSRELAAQLSVARGAVVAGFERLVADGFAEARVGAGTFVAGAVPRLAPVAPAARAGFVAKDLPGDLGLAFPDPQSLEAFRVLVNRHLARPAASLFHYGDPAGDAGLRGSLAAWLRLSRGMRLHADQIVLTSGTQGALDLIARAVLAPGDAVWMEDPGYPSGKAAFAAQRLVPVPVDAEGLDVAEGRRRAPEARAAYVTPAHQFPLGVAMTMRRRLALLDWAAEAGDGAGAWVIEDDYDSEFRYAGAPLAALQGMDAGGRVIHVGTFSKALMPGLRMGWLVLPEPLIDPVLALRTRADRAPPGLLEPAMAEFLSGGGLCRPSAPGKAALPGGAGCVGGRAGAGRARLARARSGLAPDAALARDLRRSGTGAIGARRRLWRKGALVDVSGGAAARAGHRLFRPRARGAGLGGAARDGRAARGAVCPPLALTGHSPPEDI
ncbi:MAG: PLP-dependent aminotransferase family protein [Gemmobacter sp.]|uniref:aminotransferase-like domain-containing protein n=1 Tax=Gemmobacter sp. TaxID=1898957 RepID=UPI001A4162DD|nr:PLP-dependent aminotransferase family protein [Gemmobacter sp.]MBL8560689.1 PLP-dependent aminotransferase family protein [Gemmobacter sp.]